MIPSPRRLLGSVAAAVALLMLGGCVERTMKIDSDPQGARVFVNDEEIGVTPARFSFLWYGDYDILLRKDGFETLKTHYRVDPPWYQYPPIDLIAECLIPSTIKDEHVLPTYRLASMRVPPLQEIVERAVDLREHALAETP
ncbi:MAG: PEGA domain-containing protein [Phycisphaerae bacterium]